MDQVNVQSDIDVSFAILYCSIYPTTFNYDRILAFLMIIKWM